MDDVATRVPWLALPAGLEQLAELKLGKCVCFGVKDDVRKWEDVVRGEEEVEVFKSLGLCLRLAYDGHEDDYGALTSQKLSMLSL